MSSQDQPKPGIEQQASESTLGGGMMTNQGDNNNQIQDDNNIQQQNNSQAQVNQDNSTGYQTNVDGGTAYIGNNTIIHPQSKPNAAVKEIPYIGVRHFVGRESELAKIHEALHRGKAYAISAVAGMGGVGKTELAIKYARLYEKDYSGGICWFSVRDGNLATEIIQFAQLHLNLQVPQKNFQGNPLSLIQQVTWCWENWQPCQGLVLVVLDDVTDANNFIEYLPKNSRFRVLITTRLRNLDSNIEEILLDALSEKEGLQLFVNLIGSLRVNKESATAREICQWLGYLPLGLELVGRYLAEEFDLSLASMLERLQTQHLQDEAIDINLQKGQNNYLLMTGKTSIKAAFELSWQELNTPVATVAQLLSLFALDVIPWKFVEFIAKYLNWAEETLDDAKKLLYKLQLIQSAGEGSYKIHPLIREFLQAKLLESGLADNLTLAFATSMAALAKQFPKFPSFVELQNTALIVPHLTQVAKSMTEYLSDRDLCHPFVCLAKFYEAQGLYKQAEPWRLQCLSEAQSRLCIKHPTVDVAANLHGLAKLYKYQGRYTEAEPLFLQALELRKAIIGEYDQNFTESLYELGELYLPLGRYSEAETLLWKTLELRQNLLGDSHPEIIESLGGLAMLYSYQGRDSEAELIYEKTLKLQKEFFGDNNLHVANNIYHLALILTRKQWKKKAKNPILLFISDDRRIESLFEQSIDITKRILGEDHPILAERLRELSLFYFQRKWYRKAEKICLKAIDIQQRYLGDNHLEMAGSFANLGLIYLAQSSYKKSEDALLQALDIRDHSLGKEHPELATFLNNLGILYVAQGKYLQADLLLETSQKIAKSKLGINHPGTITILENSQIIPNIIMVQVWFALMSLLTFLSITSEREIAWLITVVIMLITLRSPLFLASVLSIFIGLLMVILPEMNLLKILFSKIFSQILIMVVFRLILINSWIPYKPSPLSAAIWLFRKICTSLHNHYNEILIFQNKRSRTASRILYLISFTLQCSFLLLSLIIFLMTLLGGKFLSLLAASVIFMIIMEQFYAVTIQLGYFGFLMSWLWLSNDEISLRFWLGWLFLTMGFLALMLIAIKLILKHMGLKFEILYAAQRNVINFANYVFNITKLNNRK